MTLGHTARNRQLMSSVSLQLERHILETFMASARQGSFNGVSASNLATAFPNVNNLRAELTLLVEADFIEGIFACQETNPHIKRFPALPKERQLELVQSEKLEAFCLYPSPRILAKNVAQKEFSDRPFSRAMILGEAQLSHVTFELGVLGRYRANPRYIVKFNDYMGEFYLSTAHYCSDEVQERDKTGINSFGLAVDKNQIPYIVVFYRYLADLTPEHQQYWHSFRAAHLPMCNQYFQSSIMGGWWKNLSIRYAIQEEMRLVNVLSNIVFGKKLFRREMTDDLPFDLSAFLVPSTENFSTFIQSWDKLLSDNLSNEFFKGNVAANFEEARSDGRIAIHAKGTIRLLREWLELVITDRDKAEIIGKIVDPIKQIRKLRQEPAHTLQANQFSHDFQRKRREVLQNVLGSLSCLRTVLARHQKANGVDIPDWLDEGEIEVF